MARFRHETTYNHLLQPAAQSSLHDFILLQKQFKNSKPRSLDNDILVDPTDDG